MQTKLDIFIFSHNRGLWLRNLLNSIRQGIDANIDSRLVILDDKSTETATLEVLEEAKREGIRVVHRVSNSAADSGPRGGLHEGIAFALRDLARPNSLALLLQDDMQIVRKVANDELEKIRQIGRQTTNPFTYVNFWTQGISYRRSCMHLKDSYYQKFSPKEQRYRAYTDVCLVDIEVFRAANFDIQNSEKLTDEKAYAQFGEMPWYPFPFTAMLPEPIIHWKRNAFGDQVHSFAPMTTEAVQDLFLRDLEAVLPVAESFLALENGAVLPTPWKYEARPSKLAKITGKLNAIRNGFRFRPKY